MNDEHIVNLYWNRNELAISETSAKYGRYLNNISYNILFNSEDAAECVNETYFDAWNSMPSHYPSILSTYLGKITRRISIDKWRKKQATKRGGGEITLALEELEDCIAGTSNVEKSLEKQELIQLLDNFLDELPVIERKIIICRYWYMDSILSISKQFNYSQSKVTFMLHRTRQKLRNLLTKEGY